MTDDQRVLQQGLHYLRQCPGAANILRQGSCHDGSVGSDSQPCCIGHRIDSLDPGQGFDAGSQGTQGAQGLGREYPLRKLNMKECYFIIAEALLKFAVLR